MRDPERQLFIACRKGDDAAIGKAIASGVDIHAGGDLAICMAAESGHVAAVRRLIDVGANPRACGRALYGAAAGGHAEVVRVLLATGAVVSDALLKAAAKGHTNAVVLIMEADGNTRGHQCALSWAARRGLVNAARTLMAAGVDPVAAWSSTPPSARGDMVDTFDACVDVMTREQCVVLAGKSGRFVAIRAVRAATQKQQAMCRQSSP